MPWAMKVGIRVTLGGSPIITLGGYPSLTLDPVISTCHSLEIGNYLLRSSVPGEQWPRCEGWLGLILLICNSHNLLMVSVRLIEVLKEPLNRHL